MQLNILCYFNFQKIRPNNCPMGENSPKQLPKWVNQARKKTTTNIGGRRIAIYNCNCNVRKEIKPPHWGGRLKKIAQMGKNSPKQLPNGRKFAQTVLPNCRPLTLGA
jgi:hypothetical protein